VGLAARLQAFTYFRSNSDSLTSTGAIGGELRGIRDDQNGADNYPHNVLRTPTAVIVNLDVPVRLFTTDWRGWGAKLFKRNMPAWFHVLDFELQLSPFVDLALTDNIAAGSPVGLKDSIKAGWYSAGIEVLVYPERWRSVVVRLSAGMDLGYRLFRGDRDWQQEPNYPLSSILPKVFNEITFGVGWFF
jgi:hypothetical protein